MKLLDTLFVILLVLKLFGLIAISWWWVFTPLLIAIGATVILYLFLKS